MLPRGSIALNFTETSRNANGTHPVDYAQEMREK
jgi:hypothetical protein